MKPRHAKDMFRWDLMAGTGSDMSHGVAACPVRPGGRSLRLGDVSSLRRGVFGFMRPGLPENQGTMKVCKWCVITMSP